MTRRGSFGWGEVWALLLVLPALAFSACASELPPEPALTADPPRGAGSVAADGAAQTEIDRGVAFVKNEKYAEAKEHFYNAIAVKPSAEAWTYVGVTAEKTGNRGAAEDAYKSALKLDPSFVEAAQNLSALYLDDPARPDDAIALLKVALEKSPGTPRLLQNLGFAYGLKGDVEGAGRAYEASVAKGEDAHVRFAYGTLLFEKKQPEKAAEQLKKALAAAQDDAPLLVSVGRLLGGTKAFGDCVTAFDRALKIKATDAEWFVRRGTCKHELKDEEGAEQDFKAAVKVDPTFAAARYYLGLSLLAQKKRLAAITELEKAGQLGGDGPIGKSARAKFDELTKQTKKKK